MEAYGNSVVKVTLCTLLFMFYFQQGCIACSRRPY